jgi:hypothetical protein
MTPPGKKTIFVFPEKNSADLVFPSLSLSLPAASVKPKQAQKMTQFIPIF